MTCASLKTLPLPPSLNMRFSNYRKHLVGVMCSLPLCLALAQTVPGVRAPENVAKPAEMEMLNEVEVQAYCAAYLGSMGNSLASLGDRGAQSFEYFATQSALVFELAPKQLSDETVLRARERVRSRPAGQSGPYCLMLGQTAYARADETARGRADARAREEVRRRTPKN